jgi:hypothetical protein
VVVRGTHHLTGPFVGSEIVLPFSASVLREGSAFTVHEENPSRLPLRVSVPGRGVTAPCCASAACCRSEGYVLDRKIRVGMAEVIFVLRISRMARVSVHRWQLSSEVASQEHRSTALQNPPAEKPERPSLLT